MFAVLSVALFLTFLAFVLSAVSYRGLVVLLSANSRSRFRCASGAAGCCGGLRGTRTCGGLSLALAGLLLDLRLRSGGAAEWNARGGGDYIRGCEVSGK